MQNKDGELDFIKKKIKVTKINELEIELDVTKNHLEHLRQFID